MVHPARGVHGRAHVRGAASPLRENSKHLSWREVLSFGGGSVASNLSWNMVAGFLIVYYTDVALLPASVVGSIVLVTRIFDAAIDPAVGLLVDRTRTRFGKARPYLLFAAVPFALLSILTFDVPHASLAWKIIYACLTFGLLGVGYSFLYVPYSALLPLMTSDGGELLRLSGIRAMGTSLASIVVYAGVMPAVIFLGHGDRHRGYVWAASLFAILTTALYVTVFLNCRERVFRTQQSRRTGIWRSLANLSRNKIWTITMMFEILIFVRLGFLVPSMAYYAKEVMGAPWLTSVLLPLISIAILLGGFIGPRYLLALGKRRGMIIALFFSIACFAAIPICGNSPKLVLPLFFLANISTGVQATLVFALIAEAVDWHRVNFGVREEGLLSSTASLSQKLGFAVGSASLAYALALTGYHPHSTQGNVRDVLTWLVSIVPAAISAFQVVCIAFYAAQSCATPSANG
jgi:GPH family glycoside/pentoside/hexuronide:cation symporter